MTPRSLSLVAAVAVALWLRPGVGQAASLLDETHGVVGRDEVVGASEAEARARRLVDHAAWEEALSAWREARRAGADERTVSSWEVVSLTRLDQWGLAHLEALASLAQDSSSEQRRLMMAWLLCAGGAEKQAIGLVRNVPERTAGAQAAAVLELRAWRQLSRPGKVRRARKRLLARVDADAWVWWESSRGHFAAAEPEAFDDLVRALRAPRASATHLGTLLELRLALDEPAEALALGLAGMERFPNEARIAVLTATAAGLPLGRARLDRALKLDPERAAALEVRGVLALAQDAPDAALADLTEAARLGRASAANAGMRARALQAVGQSQEALALLTQASKRFPQHLGLAEDRFELADRAGSSLSRLHAADAWRDTARGLALELTPQVARSALTSAVELQDAAAVQRWAALALDGQDVDLALLVETAVVLLEGGSDDASRSRARGLAVRAATLRDRGGTDVLAADDSDLLAQLRRWSQEMR